MLSLPFICDLYNPLLLAVCIAVCGIYIKQRSFLRLLRFFGIIFVVYGLMYIDKLLQWWPSFGLDYSTHTATALAMCLFIAAFVREQEIKGRVLIFGVLGLSLIAYEQLMVVLNYHSWADIVSTAAVVGGILVSTLAWKSKTQHTLKTTQ